MDSSVVVAANLAPLHSFKNMYIVNCSSIIARWMPRHAVWVDLLAWIVSGLDRW